MPAYPATRIITQQRKNQYAQRVYLPLCTAIFGLPFTIESTLITDTYTFTIEATDVRTNLLYRPGRFYITVLTDIKMIPRSIKSPPAMADVQIVLRKTLVLACGGTMDHYQVYRSHHTI